jgi:hypothetical protein
MSRHYLANDINRLLLWRCNRAIARSEKAKLDQEQACATSQQMVRDAKAFDEWSQKHADHPLVQQVSAEIDRLDHDLRLSNRGRMERMATVIANGVRLAREADPTLPRPVTIKSTTINYNAFWWAVIIVFGLATLSQCHLTH